MTLFKLPNELIVEILLFLDVPDAYAIQAVSHFFYDLYETSLDLQYALECRVAGVRDNPNCHLPILERLRILRERESAWSSLTPTSRRTIRPPQVESLGHLEMQPYHCMAYRDVDLTTPMIQKDVKTSSIREIEWSFLISILIGDLMRTGYCIDEHDLIACLTKVDLPDSQFELRLVLLQYSTGKAHPLAMQPDILVCREAVSNMHSEFIPIGIQIFGENLVVSVVTGTMEEFGWMYVYNWKSGKAKCGPIRASNTDIVILDHNLVIIYDIHECSVCIFHIPSSSSGGSVKLIQKLKLPLVQSGTWVRCLSLPNPTGDGQFPKYVPSSVPFMDRPDTALVYFALGSSTSILVHRCSIIKLLPPPEDWIADREPLILDWNSWGPPVTAIISRNIATYGQRSVHISGLSIVCSDFNTYHVRRSVNAKQPDPCTLEKALITRLPSIKAVSSSRGLAYRVYIADGAVIQMKLDNTIEELFFGR